MSETPPLHPLAVLAAARAERVFPGAVLWLGRGAQGHLHRAAGALTYDDAAAPVTTATVYDLASLTKLFVLTAGLVLAGRGELALERRVGHYLPELDVAAFQSVSIIRLLNHTSGVRFAIQDLHEAPVETWMSRIAAEPAGPPGEVLYSCTNYFLLARALEAVTGTSLDALIEETILAPLGLRDTSFVPRRDFAPERIAPTEIDAASGEPWRGLVHDEAARAWTAATGTACGNAGLFGTASDVAKFAQLWVRQGAWHGRQLLPPALVQRALCESVPENSWRRGWGWQIDARFFMGDAPPGTAGHTGFTGPTLALNLQTGHIVIILNNRVHPTRQGPDRMPCHRAIAQWCYAQS